MHLLILDCMEMDVVKICCTAKGQFTPNFTLSTCILRSGKYKLMYFSPKNVSDSIR